MLSDPQSVTINSVAVPLPLTKAQEQQRTYTSADGLVALLTKQNVTKNRFRREVRLSKTQVATNPLDSTTDYQSSSVYLVIDEPKVGFTDAELGQLIDALKSFLSSTVYNKILAGEM